MSATRIALGAGIIALAAFVVLVAIAAHLGIALVVVVALAALIGGGSVLYGRHSHYAAVVDRTRTAQEAHDRAADEAAEARRAEALARRQRGRDRHDNRT